MSKLDKIGYYNLETGEDISKEMFERFVDYCKKFLKKKSIDFFEIKEVSVSDLKKDVKTREELVVLEIESLKGKEDVVGSKLRKVFDFILQKSSNFKIIRKGWQWDKKKEALFWFYVDKKKLDVFEIRKGPRVKNEYHAKRFKKKYGVVYVKKGRVYAKVKRKYRDLGSFLKQLVKHEYVKERVKKVKVIS